MFAPGAPGSSLFLLEPSAACQHGPAQKRLCGGRRSEWSEAWQVLAASAVPTDHSAAGRGSKAQVKGLLEGSRTGLAGVRGTQPGGPLEVCACSRGKGKGTDVSRTPTLHRDGVLYIREPVCVEISS